MIFVFANLHVVVMMSVLLKFGQQFVNKLVVVFPVTKKSVLDHLSDVGLQLSLHGQHLGEPPQYDMSMFISDRSQGMS